MTRVKTTEKQVRDFNQIKGQKVLVLAEDMWLQDSLKIYFASIGCQVTSQEDFTSEIVNADLSPFDIVIVNNKILGISGLDFFEKTLETSKKSAKFLIADRFNSEQQQKARELGITQIFGPPLSAEALEQGLSKINQTERPPHYAHLMAETQNEIAAGNLNKKVGVLDNFMRHPGEK